MATTFNTIYPCIWSNGQAAESAAFYCDVFPGFALTGSNPMVATIESGGQRFMFLNGGPQFKPNPSISFFVVFETEAEIDRAWAALEEGGQVLMGLDNYPWSEKYGWIQDKFGLSWQLSLGKLSDVGGQRYTPSLMFTPPHNGRAEEAIRFYTGIFDGSSVEGILPYSEEDPDVTGTVKHAQFKLGSHTMMAMDSSSAHKFSFNEGISLVVECETQQQIDGFWDQLTAGGAESQCGWLKDKFGVSWQVVPSILPKLLGDPARAERVVAAFMQMKKFDIETLKNA